MCGGNRLGGALAAGNYLEPTIFDRTTANMRIVREEIFAPVLVVQTFDTEAQALHIANDTEYGLAAASSRKTSQKRTEWCAAFAPGSRG